MEEHLGKLFLKSELFSWIWLAKKGLARLGAQH